MQLRAMAKINLGLDVVRKREDGYHEVRMIMQTIRMFDRVTVYRIPEPEIRISSNLHFLPVNENNIAYKAARMMLESQPVRGGTLIHKQVSKLKTNLFASQMAVSVTSSLILVIWP